MTGSVISIQAPTSGNAADNVASASTIDELLACCPRTYQAAFGPLFRKLSDTAVKASHAQNTLSNFESHFSNNTFPPAILGSFKLPTVQVTKEFSATSDLQQWNAVMDTQLFNARRLALEQCIALKRIEHTHLLSLISDPETKRVSQDAYTGVWNALASTFATGIDDKGQTTYSNFFAKEYNFMRSYANDLCRKAIAIGFAKHQRELVSKMSKLALKKDTDSSMSNMPQNDIQKTIEEAVAKALKARNIKNSKPPIKGSTPPTCFAQEELTPYSQSPPTRQPQPKTSQPVCEEHRKGKRKRKREWREETEKELNLVEAALSRKRFRPRDYSSYPNEFFNVSLAARQKFMLLHSTTQFVDSLPSFTTDVFMGPSVSLPTEIRTQLSLNGKFVLHSQKDTLLVPSAMTQLRRSIRIKWLFRHKEDQSQFIPKFHVKSTWEPPLASHTVERAIDAIQAALFQQVSALPHKAYEHNPETKHLRQFLQDASYLVKITDKNLGLAVVTKEWYMNQTHLHLADANAYEVTKYDLVDLLQKFKQIATEHKWTSQIHKYLQTSTATLPKFHVIPKVHKNPWSSRPIIPSHSWVTSRASEVIDYFLQPEIRKLDFVLDSTKSLIQGIRGLSNLQGATLVTGDVRAMYTNIPAEDAVLASSLLLQQADLKGNTLDGLTELLRFVLHNNFFTFQDETYRQRSGLAMGTACAPAVANCFMARYESQVLPILRSWGLLYYGRYIDDIFLIFKGTEEALDTALQMLVPPGLDIEWTRSSTDIHFLDVQLYLIKDSLVTDVYRKALNRYMYIPFSSGHPIRVKKALVKAERTRFAMICSTEDRRLRVERHFRVNLYRRGYPSTMLDKWFSLDLKPREERTNLYLLPSEYNPVWEYINVQKLEEAYRQVVLNTNVENELPVNIILSLKRGRNLYDIFHRENMTILTADGCFGSP